MITRIWHGWTEPAAADAYETLWRRESWASDPIELFRRPAGDEVEFATVMWFDSLDDVKAFAGEDYEMAYVPERRAPSLKRFDPRSQHYEVRERREGSA